MSKVVVSNPAIQGGAPCFVGTRVPVASLFQYLEAGYNIDYFVDQFPTVSRDLVVELLREMSSVKDDGPRKAS